jgi:peptidyl-prolyl cis-trans isomerase B (cyclophilin B)
LRRVALLLAALAVAGCGGGDDNEASSTEAGTTTAAARTQGGCRQVEAPEPKESGGETKPTAPLPAGTQELEVETNCGAFTITLDPKSAPKTTASVAALADSGYYDGTTFHRIVPGFVIQGGDPTATGTGGPGYSTVDAPKPTTRYTEGVVAMAKTQSEAPGTSGSQFFIVTGADIGLPPEYAVIGKVTKGLPVVRKIGKLGNPTTEEPTEVIVIDKMRHVGG